MNDLLMLMHYLLSTSNIQVLFLKEFCQFSQTLQPQSRESFYKTLSNLGVLPGTKFVIHYFGILRLQEIILTFQGLETTLQSPVKETKAASVDILLFIVDYSPSLVRIIHPFVQQ